MELSVTLTFSNVPADSDYDSVSLDLVYTRPAGCVPEGLMEVIDGLNLRVNIPRPSAGGVVFASTLPDNATRIDSEGGIFTARFKQVVLDSQTVNIGTDSEPGVEVVVTLPVTGLSDPVNAIKDLNVFVSPLSAAIAVGAATYSNGNIRIPVTRMKTGLTAPYEAATVTISGTLTEVFQPEPAA